MSESYPLLSIRETPLTWKQAVVPLIPLIKTAFLMAENFKAPEFFSLALLAPFIEGLIGFSSFMVATWIVAGKDNPLPGAVAGLMAYGGMRLAIAGSTILLDRHLRRP